MLFNLNSYSSTDKGSVSADVLTGKIQDVSPSAPQASYAYLIHGDQTSTVAAVFHLRDRGFRVAVLTQPTKIDGVDYAGGTAVVRVGQNDSRVHDAIKEITRKYSLKYSSVNTGLSEPGFPALGTGDHAFHVAPSNIAIVGGHPMQGYSFGWTWYTLDQQYDIPTTVIESRVLGRTDLSEFDVLVFPDISDTTTFKRQLGKSGMNRVKQWVRDGGTLVTLARGTDFATKQMKLLSLRDWYGLSANKKKQRITVPGAIFKAKLDKNRWLTSGYSGDELPFLIFSNRLMLPPDGAVSSGRRVVASLPPGVDSKMSGHTWKESDERLPGAVLVYEQRSGRGRVIAFAEDVNFRAFWRGTNRMFLNAVILGPNAP